VRLRSLDASENLSKQAQQLADANNVFIMYHTRSAHACALHQNRVKYTLDCTCEMSRSGSVVLDLHFIRTNAGCCDLVHPEQMHK